MVARYNPCGRVVDIGRATGRTRARLYPDSDVEFDLEWYVARDDAPLLGCPSAVNRLEWEKDHDDWMATDVGEVYGTWEGYTYFPVRPLAIGLHRCGTDADFMGDGRFDGQPPFVEYREDGLPTCCGPAAEGDGGAVGGGSSAWWYYPPALGGAVGGGSSAWWYYPPALGGAVGGGTAPMWVGLVLPTDGGAVGGGSSAWWYYPPALGGAVGGGTAPMWVGLVLPTDGGAVGGGTAPTGYGPVYHPYGGGVAGGSSEWWYFTLIEGAGGGVAGGSSEWWYFTLIEGAGGGVAGGSAPGGYTPVVEGEGGGVGGGEAEWSYGPPVFCSTYHVETQDGPDDLTQTSPSSWVGTQYTLTVDLGLNWTLQNDLIAHAWQTDTPWLGTGTREFAPIGALDPAYVSCAD